MFADTAETQKSLLVYLAETAHELALAARGARPADSAAMLKEAEELMAIRSRIIHRGAQLELPLEIQRAA